MHFKHPEILWALFLLLIPLIVHLFRLRRFKQEAFTNVRFLKEIEMQTRKSATLKKWLVLISRMLGLAMLVLAFAQPYQASSDKDQPATSYTVYIDNSFSMQLPEQQGNLLSTAVARLLDEWPEDIALKVITNDNVYGPGTLNELRDELLGLEFTEKQLAINEVIFRTAAETPSARQTLYLLSDLQERMDPGETMAASNISVRILKIEPGKFLNLAIDSLAVNDTDPEQVELTVFISQSGQNDGSSIPVSVLSGEKLLARSTLNLAATDTTIRFNLKKDELQNARIEISDAGLQYDNSFYFNLPDDIKINVYHISDSTSAYLPRIYTEDEFEYVSVSPSRVDYDELSRQNLIILDQITSLSPVLSRNLATLADNGVSILQIPAFREDGNSWQSLNLALNLPQRDSLIQNSAVVNRINYDHPLLADVFNNRVENFKYPEVQNYYSIRGRSAAILEFSGGIPFLFGSDNAYAFNTPLFTANTDFMRSALVVPVFYNIGIESLQLPKPYLTRNIDQETTIKVTLRDDEILKLSTENATSFIPRQQNYGTYISLFLDDEWKTSGHYKVYRDNQQVGSLSVNFSRAESNLQYLDTDRFPEAETYSSIATGLEQVKNENMVNELWKWFVIFAIAFFLTEMLLLKFFK